MERARLTRLLTDTGCAQRHGDFVFLCDPRWNEMERRLLASLTDLAVQRTAGEGGWLCIPTGGTSGTLRVARHDEWTVSAAAAGFRAHFGLDAINAVDVLPPFHVSGLMTRVRCAVTGGVHVPWDWRRLAAGERPEIAADAGSWVLSLVPTQLQRMLGDAEARAWLRRFRLVLIGGGPIWPELADTAAAHDLPLSLSYGMTETAAMVTALTPEEFLGGGRSAGRALPHAHVAVTPEGVIEIRGESVFRGYFPHGNPSRRVLTEDLGEIDQLGCLRVHGRRDAVIITGGEKANPSEIEAALRATGEFEDIAVIGLPDGEWGEVVVACYPAGPRPPALATVESALRKTLSAFKRPKRYMEIAEWPRNEHGKLNRAKLAGLAEARRSP